jgi:hypothetical protein
MAVLGFFQNLWAMVKVFWKIFELVSDTESIMRRGKFMFLKPTIL